MVFHIGYNESIDEKYDYDQEKILLVSTFLLATLVVQCEADDGIGIRPVGVLAQSFDHRAVDGAYSAAFLSAVCKVIETRHWSQDLHG